MRADLEVLSTAVGGLEPLCAGLPDRAGARRFFRALAKELPIDDEVRETIRSSIEQKNYAALDTILDRLEQSQAVLAIRRLPRLFGGEEVFDEAFGLCSEIQEAQEPLEYLKGLYQKLAKLGMGNKLMIDLGDCPSKRLLQRYRVQRLCAGLRRRDFKRRPLRPPVGSV